MNKPKIIGITGNIGAGKSTVSKLFAMYNWPIFDSDLSSKTILKENQTIQSKIIDLFGNSILREDGKIQNQKLANIVFSDAKALSQLNSILHPEVKLMFNSWLNKQVCDFVIRESALLFETGIYAESFKNIVVTCPFELRLKRIQDRQKITTEQISAREKMQMNELEKVKLADYEINNSLPLLPQINQIHEKLVSTTN